MKMLLAFLSLLVLAAQARVPATFDLRVTKLEVMRMNGTPMPSRSQVVLDEPFKIRVTIKNDGPKASVPGWLYYIITKDACDVIKHDAAIPALAPGATLSREFTAKVHEQAGLWSIEGSIEVASPPDKDHMNNHIGLYMLHVLAHPAHKPQHVQGGETH